MQKNSINKISFINLDKQAVSASDAKPSADDKGKRKRIIKTTTANSTEEAVVESGDEPKEIKREKSA